MVNDLHEAEVETTRPVHQAFRAFATLIGVAALVVAAFTDWIPGRAADDLTLKSLIKTDMGAQSDFVKTVGGLAVLIALVALLGLVDRTGWLTRLAGAAALIVFVMFAVQSYRYYGSAGTAFHHSRLGVWLLLGGGLVLLLGGLLGARVTRVQAVLEEDPKRAGMRRMRAGRTDHLRGTDTRTGDTYAGDTRGEDVRAGDTYGDDLRRGDTYGEGARGQDVDVR